MKLILTLTTLLSTALAMDSTKQIRHQSHRASQDHRAAGIGSGAGPAACESAIAQVNPSLDACGIPNSVTSVAGLSTTQTQCICAIDMTQIGLACAAQTDVTAVLTQLQGLCSGAPVASSSSSASTTSGTGFGGFLAPAASAGSSSGVASGSPTGVSSGPAASGTGTASAVSRSASPTGTATAVTTIPPATTGTISTIALPKSSAKRNGSVAMFALTAYGNDYDTYQGTHQQAAMNLRTASSATHPMQGTTSTEYLLEQLRGQKPLHTPAYSSVTGMPLFSGDRYEARRSIEPSVTETQNEFRIDAIAFETLVAENSDDVMIEARSLLRQWIENEPVSVEDDVSNRVSMREPEPLINHLLATDEEASNMRRRLHEIVGCEQPTPQKVVSTMLPKPAASQTRRTSMDTRQSLAKHRRELAELQRLSNLESKIDLRHHSARQNDCERVASENTCHRMEKWELDVTRKVEEKESKILIERERIQTQKERESLVEAKKEQKRLEDQAKYDAELARRKYEEKERKRSIGLAKAEELFVLKCLRTVGAEQLAAAMKKNHENHVKADRHFRITTISKVYLAWHTWHKIEMENKKLLQRHQERSQKMKEFLVALEKDVSEARREKKCELSCSSPTKIQASEVSHPTPHVTVSSTGVFCESNASLLKIRRTKLKEISFKNESRPQGAKPDDPASRHATPRLAAPHHATAYPAAPPPPVAPAAEQTTSLKEAVQPLTVKKAKIKSLKAPDILEQMKQREVERLERKNAAEEKRKAREAEIRAEKEAVEQQKRDAEEAERKRFMSQKLEKRRLAKLAEDEKLKEKEKRLLSLAKANAHNQKRLTKTQGILPWKILVTLHKQDEQLAVTFRQKWDMRDPLLQWRRKLELKRQQREHAAKCLYDQKQALNAWNVFRSRFIAQTELEKKAALFNDHQLRKQVLGSWRQKTKESIFDKLQAEREKEIAADKLAMRLMPKRILRKWFAITREIKEERWREWRRQQLRSRIKEMLSASTFEEKLKRDFTPVRNFQSDITEKT
ncbi:hypothetical protein HDU81_003180 [Chytriomyces hyalinus]|nr:hypothetical protein HDU81_003180 [Chytriomyces hyalinus]